MTASASSGLLRERSSFVSTTGRQASDTEDCPECASRPFPEEWPELAEGASRRVRRAPPADGPQLDRWTSIEVHPSSSSSSVGAGCSARSGRLAEAVRLSSTTVVVGSQTLTLCDWWGFCSPQFITVHR